MQRYRVGLFFSRSGLGSALLAFLALGAAPAAADTVAGTRFDLRERVHSVDVRLEHGHATLVVTRVVDNAAPRSDQAMFHIDLPPGAVATRLRAAGTGPHGEAVWFEGELMEAEAAAQKYTELTGIGGYYPKDPALLSWRSQRHLALQVFPVMGRGSKTVEYTMQMPMEYADGVYRMTLPQLGTGELPAKVRVTPANPEETVEINGVGVAAGSAVIASRELEVRLKPRGVPALEGALASFGFASARVLVHARVAAAPRLGQTPAHAAVVVLLDTSRSMEDDVPSELAAARAYLSHFPSADVEVMTFDRKVRSPFGGPLPVREALARLYSFAPAVSNGSRIDDAMARADARLGKSTAGARRILLLTDLRTREALTPERFAAHPLASGAVLHIATLASHPNVQLERDDQSPWSKLPRSTGGLLWHASFDGALNDTSRAVFEEWVRPKRIQRVTVKGLPGLVAPNELLEGAGIEHLAIEGAEVAQFSIEGELWSRSVRWSASSSAGEARRWAGLVFGSTLLGELSEAEQMTLAMHGRAVSPVTSFLAIEPGVRPSTEGLEVGESGVGGGVGTAQGFGTGFARYGSGNTPGIDRQGFVDRALATALAACAVRGRTGRASIESTRAEVVDVRDVELGPARDAKAEACITEQLWTVMLPGAFIEEHATWNAATRP